MAIRLEYGASPATVIMAGYAAGTGKRKQREEQQRRKDFSEVRRLRYDQLKWQQNRADRFGLAKMGIEAGRERDQFRADEAQARDERRFEHWDEHGEARRKHDRERDQERFGHDRARDQERFDREKELGKIGTEALERAAEQRHIQQGLQSGRLYYTPEQKEELRKLADAEAKISTSQQIAPEQRDDLLQEIRERRRHVKPLERPADEQPKTPAEAFRAGTFRVNPETGLVVGEGEPGALMQTNPKTGMSEPVKFSDKKDTSGADAKEAEKKWYEALEKDRLSIREDIKIERENAGDSRPITDEEVNERIRKEWASRGSARGALPYTPPGGFYEAERKALSGAGQKALSAPSAADDKQILEEGMANQEKMENDPGYYREVMAARERLGRGH